MRVLALDYGSARCGVAVSDVTGTLATPLDVVERPGTKKGMTRIVDVVREREAERVVVGLPLGLSGHDTDQTREAREFAANLQRRLGKKIPVELEDERFTTALAQRDIDPRAAEDSRAAAHLLEGWLSRVMGGSRGQDGPDRQPS
ncbi:MAG: Holliday junction resolvase RuvX [Solirubrobacteraceae bacterium]|nr:Holliday junction resolvase RuvX [Solirubrobacteraceae bacterium]